MGRRCHIVSQEPKTKATMTPPPHMANHTCTYVLANGKQHNTSQLPFYSLSEFHRILHFWNFPETELIKKVNKTARWPLGLSIKEMCENVCGPPALVQPSTLA
ncbi:hypothetical protein XENTR_v10003143 [Xenopus tropicalis]|nr:hypothetical protein XENTR_v10003143 [Xenopus tropicalis]